jgi:hypothetical protein
MSSFFSSDRFFGAAAATGAAGGVSWSRWLTASDLSAADANSVTVVSGPSTSGDSITMTIQNDSTSSAVTVRTAANWSFDLASVASDWDPNAVQAVLVDMRISALATRGMLTVGVCNLASGAEQACSVGLYDRTGNFHAGSMIGTGSFNRSASLTAVDQSWCTVIGDPDFTQGVAVSIMSEDGTNVRASSGANDFGALSTTFAISVGFSDGTLRANEVLTFQMRFAVIDLD